jgi:hypothetical protein
MIVSIYILTLLLIQLFLAHLLIRENTFYLVFWKANLYFSIFLTLGALMTNAIFSFHPFSLHVSNFLYPLLDFFHFFVFTIFFILFVGKYTPKVSNKNFCLIINFLLLTSLVYSILNLYFLIEGKQISLLKLFFPFGMLIHSAWFVGPLFGSFYWSKLSKNQKIILIFSIFFIFLLSIVGGRRSTLLFTSYFLIFWCFRIIFLKKIILVVFLIFSYIPLENFHTAFKNYAHTGKINLAERFKNISNLDRSGYEQFMNTAVLRILHQYLLIESVHKELEIRDDVGLKPYKTAIMSIIPSRFLDDKPWPGSIDGKRYSSFPYIVNRIAFGHYTNMSEYPISLEFVWHGSYILALVNIVLSIIIMIAFYRMAIFFGDRLVILPLLAVFPGDYNFFVTGIIQISQMFSYIYLPGFLILILIVFLKNVSSNKIKKSF